MNDGKGQLAFAQVATDGFPERDFFAGEVEQVVDDLERHADVEPILPQRFLLLASDRAEHAADACASRKEIRRLALNDLEVFRLGQVRVAVLCELVISPSTIRRVTSQSRRIIARSSCVSASDIDQIQEVAEEHRHVIAPPRVHGLATTTELRLVDDVVVNERCGVNEPSTEA